MDDLIDIYDANLRVLGTKYRNQAHYDGDWHRTFHCWVIATREGEPAVLFQKRSPTVRSFPNTLDVSVGGHLTHGESPEQGIREVTEELGISVNSSSVVYIGDRVEVADQDNGQRNREYQAVHLLHLRPDQCDFEPDVQEVFGLYWMKLAEGQDFFARRRSSVIVEGIALSAGSRFHVSELKVTLGDFVPRFQRYYLAALICAERLLEGKKDIAIS